jgi:hypothetical protein
MDVNAQNDTSRQAHGRMSPFRNDTSTQLAIAVGLSLLVAVALHVKFNTSASVGVKVGR